MAVRDDDLLVVHITLLDILEDDWPPVGDMTVDPTSVQLAEADIVGAVEPRRFGDDLARLLQGCLPPRDRVRLMSHPQRAPGVVTGVHPVAGVGLGGILEGVVNEREARGLLPHPLNFTGLVGVPQPGSPPPPAVLCEGGFPRVEPLVGVLDGVDLLE